MWLLSVGLLPEVYAKAEEQRDPMRKVDAVKGRTAVLLFARSIMKGKENEKWPTQAISAASQ